MMRSLYSAVSGLKTHQTRMDVIGNNISNVNTEAFKASQVRFNEIMYQTTASASGGNGATGIGGINAKQIGLGAATASTTCNITGPGAAETTGNPFDLRLTDSQTTNFYIVSDGTKNMFTRAGSFYVDGNGYLCMSSTGYTLQGWQVDPTTGEIRKDTVSPLQVMAPDNQTAAPEATTKAIMSGVLDSKDSNLKNDSGYVMTLGFYDSLGYSYTAKFQVKPLKNADATTTPPTVTDVDGKYTIELDDILDSKSNSILYQQEKNGDYVLTNGKRTPLAGLTDAMIKNIFPQGTTDANGVTTGAYTLEYDPNLGTFTQVSGTIAGGQGGQLAAGATTIPLNLPYGLYNGTAAPNADGSDISSKSNFRPIVMDFSKTTNFYNGGVSSMKALKGDATGDGMGKKLGALTSLSVDQQGRIHGSYDNGNTQLLGQIAVAQFANASGLEKVGNNCYQTTLNSGEFDGIGVEVSADGSKINSGELEMSNVDLSGQFTDMIVTQRGFQANSRVITTSDTFLEELINLKR